MSRTTRDCRWRFCAIASTNSGHEAAQRQHCVLHREPCDTQKRHDDDAQTEAGRAAGATNYRDRGQGIAGLVMSNSALAADDPMAGRFVLAATPRAAREVSHWEGWPAGPLVEFSAAFLGSVFKDRRPGRRSRIRTTWWACCACRRTIPAGADGELSVFARLEISQSHAGLVRLGGARRAKAKPSSAITMRRASRARGRP